MKSHGLTPVHQDYLKAIYMLHSNGHEATNSAIAEAVSVAPASATNMVKRLAEMGLIEYAPYQGVRLTVSGEQAALEIVRHHRLIELFLHDILGLPWDKVHAEAERLEHAISEDVEEAIARKLGYPLFDPHGDPIPGKDGVKAKVNDTVLTRLPVDQAARLTRVRTQDGDRLRYLGDLGLYPGTSITVTERAPFNGPLTIDVQGEHRALAFDLAELLYVVVE